MATMCPYSKASNIFARRLSASAYVFQFRNVECEAGLTSLSWITLSSSSEERGSGAYSFAIYSKSITSLNLCGTLLAFNAIEKSQFRLRAMDICGIVIREKDQ